jgi:DNA primase
VDLDLGCVDVVEFLSMLGVDRTTREDNEVRYSCPYPAHGFGDKNPSAYMNVDTTAFICFSCGAAGNAITFLADMKDVSRLQAKQWIAQKWAPDYDNIDDMVGYVKSIFEKVDAAPAEDDFEPLPEEEYEKRIVDWEEMEGMHEQDVAPGWAAYMFERGFDHITLNLWDVCYDSHTDRPCLTVRTPDGQLVGFKGRAWREQQQPKYMVIGDTEKSLAERGTIFGFRPYDASHHVFGAHMAEPTKLHGLIVCEGELNVIAMHMMGFTNTVGPSGSTLSDKQIAQIVSMTDIVTLLFDSDMQNEQQAMTAKLKLLKAIKSFEKYVRVRVCQDHEGDPAEMDMHTIYDLVSNAVNGTEWRIQQVLA